MAILDLSQLEDAPVKVRLPDGNLYDMVQPGQLSPLAAQRVSARYRQAKVIEDRIASGSQASEDDVDEMVDLLLDVAQVLLPDAPRDVIGNLPTVKLEKVVETFLGDTSGLVPA